MDALYGFLLAFAVAVVIASWRAILLISRSYGEKEEWYKRQIKAAVDLREKAFRENMELRSRNSDLEELIDTLHDERAQARRWYADAPKWMVESPKPE